MLLKIGINNIIKNIKINKIIRQTFSKTYQKNQPSLSAKACQLSKN